MSDKHSMQEIVKQKKFGFIGAGNMARALILGFIDSGLLKREQVMASAPSDRNFSSFTALDIRVTHNNLDVVRECSVVFLAVKPHFVASVLKQICRDIRWTDCLLISIASGVSLDTLNKLVRVDQINPRIIRAMPNTATQVRSGITVFSCGPHVTTADKDLFQCLATSVGVCEEVPELQMNALCGMISSSIAYVYHMMQALSDGGVKMGIPRHLANLLAPQVFVGAAKMVQESGQHPAILQEAVASPGGTTIHGLHELEKGGVRGTIMSAVEAAAKRAHELG